MNGAWVYSVQICMHAYMQSRPRHVYMHRLDMYMYAYEMCAWIHLCMHAIHTYIIINLWIWLPNVQEIQLHYTKGLIVLSNGCSSRLQREAAWRLIGSRRQRKKMVMRRRKDLETHWETLVSAWTNTENRSLTHSLLLSSNGSLVCFIQLCIYPLHC